MVLQGAPLKPQFGRNPPQLHDLISDCNVVNIVNDPMR